MKSSLEARTFFPFQGGCKALGSEAQHFDEKDPGQAIVCDYSHKVVDSGDKWTGSHSRIHMDSLEEDRNYCSHGCRHGHRDK